MWNIMLEQLLIHKTQEASNTASAGVFDLVSIEAEYVVSATSMQISKRALDVTISILLLLFICPVLLAIAIAIKLEDKGPVLFIQPRIGKGNSVFHIYKFRSMRTCWVDLTCARQTEPDDARVTLVGNIIRKLSLDELPQLLNVLRGEMSLVGPRPHAIGTSIDGVPLTNVVPNYALRHCVRPGITGWAQVNGSRGPLINKEQAQERYILDMIYIHTQSPALDLYILFRTALQVFRDPQAF